MAGPSGIQQATSADRGSMALVTNTTAADGGSLSAAAAVAADIEPCVPGPSSAWPSKQPQRPLSAVSDMEPVPGPSSSRYKYSGKLSFNFLIQSIIVQNFLKLIIKFVYFYHDLHLLLSYPLRYNQSKYKCQLIESLFFLGNSLRPGDRIYRSWIILG